MTVPEILKLQLELAPAGQHFWLCQCYAQRCTSCAPDSDVLSTQRIRQHQLPDAPGLHLTVLNMFRIYLTRTLVPIVTNTIMIYKYDTVLISIDQPTWCRDSAGS